MEIILQKQRSRAYNGCNYYRYRVTIPAQIADRMGLVGGERLDVSIAQDGILIRRMEEQHACKDLR